MLLCDDTVRHTPVQWWNAPPPTLLLPMGEVHVWLIALDPSPADLQSCQCVLSPDERTRANRFWLDRDRTRFIAGRGAMRNILARYAGIEPASLRFIYNSFGKPALSPEPSDHGLRFNLSHSGELALLAVGRNQDIGVDLERIREEYAGLDVARQFFSRHEVAELKTVPERLRALSFFLCWTRKEAYVKARGEGLSLPLDCFDVTLTPGRPAILLDDGSDHYTSPRWFLYHLDVCPDYAAALVTAGKPEVIKCWQWQAGNDMKSGFAFHSYGQQ